MHAMVCVLTEVKSHEEEYELVKKLLSRVRDLPSGFKVATRERRLLAQGLLNQVTVHGEEQTGQQHAPNPHQPSVSRVVGTRARSGSELTAVSSTTESASFSYRSTSSSTARLKDSSTEYSMRSDSSATSSTNVPFDGRRERKPPFIPHGNMTMPPRLASPQVRNSNIDRPRESSLYVLVFTDIVILARPAVDNLHPARSPRRRTQEQWNTLDALGVFRVLGATEYTGRYGKGARPTKLVDFNLKRFRIRASYVAGPSPH
jgi:hypothetical protein